MIDDKPIVIAFFGKSASGKDTAQKLVSIGRQNVNQIISYTTRPPRSNETNHVDYHFINPADFNLMTIQGLMLEVTEFNEWKYGTSHDSIKQDKINVGVFNIQGVENLINCKRYKVIPVYIYSSDVDRLKRSLSREDHPNCHEICRRFLADENDFRAIDNAHLKFKNQKIICNDNMDQFKKSLDILMKSI